MLKRLQRLALAFVLLAVAACRHQETFPDIGDQVVSPVDVAVSADGNTFYVLNADFDRTYNEGTILVLDKDGNKLRAIKVPRMGRSLAVAGTDMLVMVDSPDGKIGAKLLLFDLSQDQTNPVQKVEWTIDCSPFNAELRAGYEHFALACMEGPLFIGTLTPDRSQSTLQLVRNYGYPRRALYIDTQRQLLLGFITDPGKQTYSDQILEDVTGYDDKAKEIPPSAPNEVPDEKEKSLQAQNDKGSRQIYQFFVYDLAKEKAAGFPERATSDAQVQAELRWIYFKLRNFDGTPDPGSEFDNPNKKYYRTNFWEAKPDPIDPDVFYLSHRGPPRENNLRHANNVIKVSILDDLRATAAADGKTWTHPKTEDVLGFERVYGFNGAEVTKYSYPGDFELNEVGGQRLLLVNHFRDLVNWVRGDVYYGLAAKTIDDNAWFAEVSGNLSGAEVTTYYQVAMNGEGRALSCSFYGNAVILLQVTPGIGIEQVKRIE